MLCTYSLGGKTLDNSYRNLMTALATPTALHKDLLKAWDGVPQGITETSPNRIDPKGIPVLDYSLSLYNDAVSDRFLQDASYLVIKNITLSYSFPKKITNKMNISSLSLNASIDNLATFTTLTGMDPQQSFAGLNNNGFVTARVLSLTINIKL